MARSANVSVFRGEDPTISFTTYTTDTGTTPQNISGWTILLTVAKKRNSTDKLLSKAGSIVSESDGTFTVTIEDTDLDPIEPGTYFWDVWRTDAGSERCLGYGQFQVVGNARIPA